MRSSKQSLAAGLLGISTYVTWNCPCTKLNACHKSLFLLTTLVPLGLFLNDNGYI